MVGKSLVMMMMMMVMMMMMMMTKDYFTWYGLSADVVDGEEKRRTIGVLVTHPRFIHSDLVVVRQSSRNYSSMTCCTNKSGPIAGETSLPLYWLSIIATGGASSRTAKANCD